MDTIYHTAEQERRRFMRVPFSAPVVYQLDRNTMGKAVCHDVGRGGLLVCAEKEFPLSAPVLLEIAPPESDPIEMKGRVAWRRPDTDGKVCYAGLRIYDDDGESMLVLGELMLAGLQQNNLLPMAAVDLSEAGAAQRSGLLPRSFLDLAGQAAALSMLVSGLAAWRF